MTETAFYLNENLRSISAVVAAKNNPDYWKKSLIKGKNDQFPKVIQPSVKVVKIHHVSAPPQNRLPTTKTKLHPCRSTKVAPSHHNVFYFDEGSDLTVTDVFNNRHGKTKRQMSDKLNCIKKIKPTGPFICLSASFIIILIVAIVLLALFLPKESR